MKFEIHFTTTQGDDDFFVIEGNHLDKLQEEAIEGVKRRLGTDPWSREVTQTD